MSARKPDCRAGSATFTTVPSMKAMLEPRMVVIQYQQRHRRQRFKNSNISTSGSFRCGSTLLGCTVADKDTVELC
jgi:hypothetical protein